MSRAFNNNPSNDNYYGFYSNAAAVHGTGNTAQGDQYDTYNVETRLTAGRNPPAAQRRGEAPSIPPPTGIAIDSGDRGLPRGPLLGARQALDVQELGDLDRVGRRALAQVVAHDPQV